MESRVANFLDSNGSRKARQARNWKTKLGVETEEPMVKCETEGLSRILYVPENVIAYGNTRQSENSVRERKNTDRGPGPGIVGALHSAFIMERGNAHKDRIVNVSGNHLTPLRRQFGGRIVDDQIDLGMPATFGKDDEMADKCNM